MSDSRQRNDKLVLHLADRNQQVGPLTRFEAPGAKPSAVGVDVVSNNFVDKRNIEGERLRFLVHDVVDVLDLQIWNGIDLIAYAKLT